ncbi:uncharacterized protein LOC125568343 [Nematostella vectensis]|uniref:uncharacterized protein LOC125568343 n=1 Tax=Nematostella vectensis TaxID=45351 RepID=UPI00207726C5|nr:uncharacterized protein LOC125568343 [Nematostella vectensis]
MQQSQSTQQSLFRGVERLRDQMRNIYSQLYSLSVMDGYSYRPSVEHSDRPGRPRFQVSAEQLSCLRNEFNSWAQVARDLGVSRQTVYNRRRELGFSMDFEGFSNMSENDLDVVVREELNAFPGTGETNLIAGLRRRGLWIQRWKVRESIVIVDPINRANRWAQRIVRRPYSVPNPNFLWHIDTNMKMRRWQMCIHGCVDGFSRAIIYLVVNPNNLAATVLSCFQNSTTKWGHPSRVRADDGGENVVVGEYMEYFRGANRGSFLTGPSVRNTRIERLWRDVGMSVISLFSSLFYFMELHLLLDSDSDIHMYALHYVFLPRVQRHLDLFRERFMDHAISTAGNRTPRQLWTSGMLANYNSPNSAVRDVFDRDVLDNPDEYGDDQTAPPPDPDNDTTGVVVPPVNLDLNDEYIAALRHPFDPLGEDYNYGINIFLQVRDYISLALARQNGT